MRATDEQITAIDQAKRGESFKIMAYAGSGKTTTLRLISDQLQGKKGLYLAFNKAIADDAKSKFNNGVDCRTFHSLAYRHVDRQITDKLRLPRLSPVSLARDATLLAAAGYQPERVEVLDLFPQTPHVETVTRFTKR